MVDVPGDSSTPFSAALGGITFNLLESGNDIDWFQITLQTGHLYHINLVGYPVGGGALYDPYLQIFNNLSTFQIGDDDDAAGFNAYLFANVTTGGTFYIGVSSANASGGGYALSIYEDDIPGNISTPAQLIVGTPFTGYTAPGSSYDNDYYAVGLTAGHHYVIAIQGNSETGGGTQGLSNAFIELYGSTGTLVAAQHNTLIFTPTSSGTFYVNAGGFYTGDGGYYNVGVTETSFVPTPPADTPLSAINWENFAAPTVINVFFAEAGATVNDAGRGTFTATGWDATEIAAAQAAFGNYEAIANVHFNYVSNIAQADFVMVENPNTPGTFVQGNYGYWDVGGETLDQNGDVIQQGIVYNGTTYNVDGIGVFNSADETWSAANLAVGAYGYITLIHEIGHGMGLAHPHDTGGGSDVMHGVTSNFGDYGDFNLNQGVFTVMSYNDGWHTAPQVPERDPSSSTYGFGWQGTLMALDIAQLQIKYGANTNYQAGNNVYALSGSNAAGTYYKAIWDTGGNDTIRYQGALNAVISLAAATLNYSATGGGVVSYVAGIYGGMTIANGVQIENATSDAGNDSLTGNGLRNILSSGAGKDVLNGGGLNDTMIGGNGSDTYYADVSNDVVTETNSNLATGGDDLVNYLGAVGTTFTLGNYVERLTLFNTLATNGTGNGIANKITGNVAANTLKGLGGNDTLIGGGGKDVLDGGTGGDKFLFNAALSAATNVDTIVSFAHNSDEIQLAKTIFKGIGSTWTNGEFYSKAGAIKAHDLDDRIIYNKSNGRLYYDDDGNKAGGHGAILFATLTNKPQNLDWTDFALA